MESMSEKIKSLRAIRGMNRREFSENFGIPMRTLEDWEYGKRIPPEYVVRLLAYKVKMENFQESGNTKKRNTEKQRM